MANWVQDFLTRNPDIVSTITSRGKNHISHRDGDSIISNFTGSPCHYFEDGIWKPIDTSLVLMGTEYGTPWSKTRIKTDGSVRIVDDLSASLHTQKTSRIGLFNPTTNKFTAVITSIPTGAVSGDSVIRTAGKFIHTLQLKETGLREELRIESIGDIVGDTKSYFVIETIFGTTQLWPDGWLDVEFNKAGNIFPLPHATDANNKHILLKRYAKYTGGIQYVYTGILISELQRYTFPIVLDPDYLDSTNDGSVYGYDPDYSGYALARSTAGYQETALDSLYVGQDGGNQSDVNYYVFRSYLKFDTSAIPDGDTITQVNLKLLLLQDLSYGADFDVQIVKQDWSAQDPLSAGNREAAYDNCLSGTADDNIWKNTSNMGDGISGNLNTAWVSKTGNTYYSLRSSRDYGNNEPSQDSYEHIRIASQNHATSAYRPILTVVHGGSTAIKTIVGLAKASVKTVNGLAIASVKTWEGLA